MYALSYIHQDVRESHFGFLKGTEMENVPFDSRDNFYMDPVRSVWMHAVVGLSFSSVGPTHTSWYIASPLPNPHRPRLWDLISDEELVMYHSLHPRARPGVCIGQMKQHLELMSLRLEKGESVCATLHVQNILNSHEAMRRIRCVFAFVWCMDGEAELDDGSHLD